MPQPPPNEADVIWTGLLTLQGALASAGFRQEVEMSLPLFPSLPALPPPGRKPETDTALPAIHPAPLLAPPAEDIAREVDFAKQDESKSTRRA